MSQANVKLSEIPEAEQTPLVQALLETILKQQERIEELEAELERLKEQGLDALIISGANVTNPSIDLEPFWEPLQDVIEWASDHVTSILCSCLATHALVKHLYGIDRRPFEHKLGGPRSAGGGLAEAHGLARLG